MTFLGFGDTVLGFNGYIRLKLLANREMQGKRKKEGSNLFGMILSD